MRNEKEWKPSKFSYQKEELHVNKKFHKLQVSSWLVTESVAIAYNQYASNYVRGDLLDLGCGLCPFYGFYRERVSSVFCVDWPSSYHNSPYTDLECDISKQIPLEDSSFDVVLLSDVLEHIPTPDNLLNEIHRILRKDGCLILNVPFLYWIHEAPYDFFRYTEYGLKFLIENADFHLEIIQPVGGLLETWGDLTIKITSNIPAFRYLIPKFLFHLITIFKDLDFLQKKMTQLNRAFPLGYLVVARKT